MGGAAALLVRFGVDGAAHPGVAGVTWTGTVARTVDRHCVSCHRSGGGVLPPLDDYEPARAAAQAIKQVVITRHMPRWQAVTGFGEFANDPTLTQVEIDQIADWADS